MHHYSATLGPLPAGKQVVLQTNIKLIEYPIDGLVDDIVQALWPVVKAGTGGIITAPSSAA